MADPELGDTGPVIFAEGRFGGGKPPGPPLQPPPGGGGFDGMEPRVARLEADVGHIKSDISEIKDAVKSIAADVSTLTTDVAIIKVELNHRPGKAYIITVAVAIVVGCGAVIALAEWIKSLVATTQIAS